MPSFPVRPLMSAPLLSLALVLVPVLALPMAHAADMPTTPVENARIDDFAVGKKAIEAKNWALAASSFSKVVAQNPQNADAYNLLGYSNRWLGKYDEAFAAYNKALALDPRHKGALEYSGMGYLKVGQKAQAEALMRGKSAAEVEAEMRAAGVAGERIGALIQQTAGMAYRSLPHGPDDHQINPAFGRRGDIFHEEMRLRRKDGSPMFCDVQAQAIERFRARAQEVAKGFGFSGYTLREVAVNANEPGFVPRPRMLAMEAKAASADAAVPVEPGKSTVNVSVSGSVQLR